jgi:pimeloyl-ACP methyl ester carboxylesterase
MLMEPWLEGGTQGQEGFIRQILNAAQRDNEDVEDRYGEVGARIPVKIIWGKDDQWIPADRADKLAKMIGTNDVLLVEEAGHLIHYDQPERLGLELGRWIERLSQR